MKKPQFILFFSIFLLIVTLTTAATAYSTPDSIVAAGKVYVSGITYDPAVFFPGDTGTVTISVTNGNNNSGIVVNHASISDKSIRVISSPYDSSSTIGPGQTQDFTFSVIADGFVGNYYPVFSLSFRDADSLFDREMVQIDDTPIEFTVVDKPDAFSQGKKKTIYMQVANPRKNTVRNVILDISGTGVNPSPSRIFIGDVNSGAKIPVNFTVSPDAVTTADLTLTYSNGDNIHTVPASIPLNFGTDKKIANPVVSNVQVKPDAGFFHITGDVNNAGLETANTVMVTTLDPAVPQDPYKCYVVGALKPDDFGSFEVTFAATNAASVPLQLSYKDADGNVYNSVQNVTLPKSGVSSQASGGSNLVPFLVIAGIIVAVFVGGWIVYLRRAKK
jgi:hypothetical protein